MRKHINYILLVFFLLFFLSCGTKRLSVGYSNTCFNKNNEIVYLKYHDYDYFHYSGLPDSPYGGKVYTYLCKMDIKGNEKVIDIINGTTLIYNISEGNGRICIQDSRYSAYTYIVGEFKEILTDDWVDDAVISFDGQKVAYTNSENEAFILTISDINGSNKTEYVEGFPSYWHPDNQHVIYSIWGNYHLLDTATSNTQTLPYAYKWSHNEQRIAYYDENDHLVLMNADETGKVVTGWIDSYNRAIWSYDGEYLLSGFNLLDKTGNYIRKLREEE